MRSPGRPFPRTVFTPDRVARIRKMKHNGAPASYIAKKEGVSLVSLERRCSQLGIKRGGRVATKVGQQIERDFNAEARRRGVRPHTLLRKIVTTIVKDNLFDAVIDAETKG